MMSRVHSAEEFGGADSGAGIPGTRAAPGTQGSPGDMTGAVLAAQQGDEAAFQALFRAVQPVLLRYLTVLVGEDAEDVASEAWLQISRDLGSFSGDFDGFRGWVSTIGRNRAMDLLRRRRRRPAVSVPVEYLHDRAAAEDTEGAALTTIGTGAALALISSCPAIRRRPCCCGWSWTWTRPAPRGCWGNGPGRYGWHRTAGCASSPNSSNSRARRRRRPRAAGADRVNRVVRGGPKKLPPQE